MERVIATHYLDGHRLDVVESVDNDICSIRLLIDGELLPPDVQPDRAPTAAEAAAMIASWMPTSAGLTQAEVNALLEALDDEYKAHATYVQVLADFGDVLPFANVADAEARHIRAIERLMRHYGVPVPPNKWSGTAPRFASVAEACAASVQGEIDNGVLYDRLMAATDRPDILSVFETLRRASQERHLPAFRRCLEGRPGGGGHRSA
jgi:hypothetical protein